jgi:manganese oxidase
MGTEHPRPSRRTSELRERALLAAVVAYLSVWWLQLIVLEEHGGHGHGATASFWHWLRDGTLAVPAVLIGVLAATQVIAQLRRRITLAPAMEVVLPAVAAAVALGVASPFHALLFEGAAPKLASATTHGVEIAVALLPVTLVVTAIAAALRARRRAHASRTVSPPAPDHAPSAVAPAPAVDPRWRLAAAITALAMLLPVAVRPLAPMASAAPTSVCPSTALRTVVYELAAFQTVIPINGWGDRMPEGLMYALRGADARIGKSHMIENPNLTQPLVIRANVGDCIKISLRNDIQGRRVGIHPEGLVKFDPKDSDGAAVGNNPDTTVASGAEAVFTWYADREGEAPINDIANLDDAASGHSSVERGLYGAVVVHPTGSAWTDPVSGQPLLGAGGRAVQTSVFADVKVPSGIDFRSFAMVMMDENEDILDASNRQPTFPTTGLADSTFGVNYRSEPLRNRLRAVLEHRGPDGEQDTVPGGDGKQITLPNGKVIAPTDHFCDGWVEDAKNPDGGFMPEDPGAKCLGEESHLQSWPFGDEGKLTRLVNGKVVVDSDLLIPKAYLGDRVKFHVVNPGAKESHPWHQHTQRWHKDPANPNSPRLDVQTVGPGESYLLELEGGAGGVQGTVGDTIFHCHLYPHFAQGFWGHLRIFDRLRDGTQAYPDGTPIENLQQLTSRGAAPKTLAPTAENPGFPLFVLGQVGQRAYRPPHGVVADDFKDRAGSTSDTPFRRPGDTVREPTPLEKANLKGLGPDLQRAKPGAGFIDPCPASAPLRTYRPHAIDAPITYNRAGWEDPEGRMYVEESHLERVRSGAQQPEPYTIRARLGDCVEVLTTNSLHLDDDPDVPIDRMNDKDGVYMDESESSEVSTHVHLVKYDELGSDGTSVGWNYVQAAMPGQTYGYRWYVDEALRTVFFHDHQYPNSHQQKGLFAALQIEPADATWHDPKTGAPTDGVGTVADIRSPSGPDFREISVYYQDRSPMWRNGRDGRDARPAPAAWRAAAIDPPPEVDDYGADQGGVAVNYRNEPFQIRVKANATGGKAEPAYVYSSAVHGDPSTPVFRAYTQDPVVIRFITGAHEEAHGFNLHGHRWLNEPDNPRSTIVDSQTATLAEWMNYDIQSGKVTKKPLSRVDTLERAEPNAENGVPLLAVGGAGKPGDYLYGSAPLDDQWMGLWGIFRVPGAQVPDLQPLPDTKVKFDTKVWPAIQPGGKLNAKPPTAVNHCPVDAPVRSYNVVALQKKIVYNTGTGDHDPNGAMFVLAADETAARNGTKPDEPLFIRANVGDCVKVTLSNKLPPTGIPTHTGDVPLPEDPGNFPRSNRVSLHAGMVDFRVIRDDGSTVGYNFDQSIAPGASITHHWFVPADLEGATVPLVDLADRRGHRHHGLFGGLLIEPKGATWKHPSTGADLTSGAHAVIRWTDAAGKAQVHREFVLDWEDGLNLRDRDGKVIPPRGDVDDPYDRGNRAVNFKTERFVPRLAKDPATSSVFSSTVHGDPATPLFEAYAGDPVRLRILQSSDRGRAHTVLLSGHEWHRHANDPTSPIVSFRSMLMPGESSTHDLRGGAGGPQRISGDYLYRDALVPNQTNAGLWGILRVHEAGQAIPTLSTIR